jgi:hypothetical protein
MGKIRLVHWNRAEAEERAETLRAAGFDVDARVPAGPRFMKELRADPPDALIVDLSRLPAQGRDLALGVRKSAGTRHVPLVFAGGDPGKVEAIQTLLLDSVYTSWDEMPADLERAIADPPTEPVVPASSMEGYSGTPLAKKLGMRAGMTVFLVNAPRGFEDTLGDLPKGVRLRRRSRGPCDLVLWFPRSKRDLDERVAALGGLAGRGGLWIAWPKKASGVETDLSQAEVRRAGLAAGLVDYKIAAIDATWSGLRFARRQGT